MRSGFFLPPRPPINILSNFNGGFASVSNASSKTFSAMAIGTAFTGRYVVAALFSRNTSTTGRLFSSVTIGGVAATQLSECDGYTTSSSLAALWGALVPTGTTADIVANCNGAMNRYGCIGWVLDRFGSLKDSANMFQTANAPASFTQKVAGGGVVLGAAFSAMTGITTSWTGIDETLELNPGTDVGSNTVSAAAKTFVGAQSALSLSASPDGTSNVFAVAVASLAP